MLDNYNMLKQTFNSSNEELLKIFPDLCRIAPFAFVQLALPLAFDKV